MSKFQQLLQKTADDVVLNLLSQSLFLSLFLFWSVAKFFYKSAKTSNSLPSPSKLPFLGNLHQLGSLPHRNLQSMARKHGPIMLLHVGSSTPTLIVSSAAAAREIMRTHDLAFADRPESSASRRLLRGNKHIAGAPYGEYIRQLKGVCVLHLLSNDRGAQSFRAIREEETGLLIRKIRECSGFVDFSRMFAELTYDVASRSAFGRKYSEEGNGKKVLGEFLEVARPFSIRDFIPGRALMNRLNGLSSRVDRAAKEMDEFLEGVIWERLGNLRGNDGGNFLDILLEIYQNNSTGIPLDRNSIKAIILDVFACGTNTTPVVLEWAMAELLRHPAILKKLQSEIRKIVKNKSDISSSDLENMPYLKAVIKETLRLHPPVPLLAPRVARKDVKIMGYDVSAGTMMITNAWAIGRDPNSWAEPEKFDPDRFLSSSLDYRSMDFELIPFGMGQRGCPGTAFAMSTIEFVLANVVHKFSWELPDECKDLDMGERPGSVIHKGVPLLAVGTEAVPFMRWMATWLRRQKSYLFKFFYM